MLNPKYIFSLTLHHFLINAINSMLSVLTFSTVPISAVSRLCCFHDKIIFYNLCIMFYLNYYFLLK